MWLSLNVESNSKSFKTDLAENFLYDWSKSEKIETSKQDDMYTNLWAWLSSETKLFCKQWNFFIYINDVTVVDVHDTQSEKLLIWAFFSNFARMLQLAVVAQLSLVADFLDLRNDQSLILNDDNDKA